MITGFYMYLILFAGALQAEEKNPPHLTCKENNIRETVLLL